MKIEEAIEISILFLKDEWPGPAWKLNKALKLLIEAGKRVRELRQNGKPDSFSKLLGETK